MAAVVSEGAASWSGMEQYANRLTRPRGSPRSGKASPPQPFFAWLKSILDTSFGKVYFYFESTK